MVSIQSKTTGDIPTDGVRVEATNNVDSTTPDRAGQSDQDNLLAFQQSRDAGAFTVLVERHQGMVFGIAQRMLGCPHAAEDVVQATFLVLANSANKIRKRHSLVSWLYGVAYRISARSLRQRAKVTVSTLKDEVMVSNADPLETLNARFEQNAVFEELQRLREELKTPMVLRYLKGKSNLQVAEELELSESAVEGRLKRARKKLRLRLARKGVTFGVAIGLLQIVQRETAAASVSASAAQITSASLAGQTISGIATNARNGIETGLSNNAINLAEQEIFKMASIKVATLAVIASVVLGVAASGWALAGDRLAVVSGQQESGGEVELQSASDTSNMLVESGNPFTIQTEATEEAKSSNEAKSDSVANNEPASKKTIPTAKQLGYYSSDELSKSEIAIYEALKKPTSFDYFEERLGDVVAGLQSDHRMPVMLDEIGLETEGIDEDEMITFKVDGVRLDNALSLMLEKHNLAAIVTKEVLLITSLDRAADLSATRVYRVPDNWEIDSETLQGTIENSIEPSTWISSGGTGTISQIERGLVVSANHDTHDKINDLFKQLDRLYVDD